MFSENELRFLKGSGSAQGFAWTPLPRGIPPAIEKRILDWRAARAGIVPHASPLVASASNDLTSELKILASLSL